MDILERIDEDNRRFRLAKDKLVLRSIADRIEEMIVCSVLGIDDSEMRRKQLYTVRRLVKAAADNSSVKGPQGTRVHVTQEHAHRASALLQPLLQQRAFTRGRAAIKNLGDFEAREDPLPYLPSISKAVENVFTTDASKDDAREVIRSFLRACGELWGCRPWSATWRKHRAVSQRAGAQQQVQRR